ncbi:lytic polysaccharide monooxygenase [Lentithecium fluviatile CBS 122367]|uniref:AA9 family lytic polysaccharide monooxygenase n=1 Tax=Lentithecium fluviatile CBS 122367 TaxID=1168545 RepID=A0A6G1J9T4_9PLEO|nr:lytic polysaccharide monooxygenase [Lentithecium fluviatile CBS 122367]
MKFSLLTTAAIAQLTAAHCFFDVLVIDGQETKSLQYVRENTRQAKYNPTIWANIRDDMTPDTAEVKARSKLFMKLAVGATMQHPGPALGYMSKAPSTAQTYEGDNEWLKIIEGICDHNKDFTRDACVHGAHDGQAKFYYSCAPVKVTSGGSGTPGPTIEFPGGHKKTDPSFNFSIYGGYKPYPMPGPAV